MSVEQENRQLRQQLDAMREREIADLRERLAAAEAAVEHYREAVEHYRKEAHRNATIGRQIAADYEQTITKLKAELDVLREIRTSDRRFGRS